MKTVGVSDALPAVRGSRISKGWNSGAEKFQTLEKEVYRFAAEVLVRHRRTATDFVAVALWATFNEGNKSEAFGCSTAYPYSGSGRCASCQEDVF